MNKDPNKKDILKKCDVCRHDVFVDQYGNGCCDNCNWNQDGDVVSFPDRVMYPNRISYSKARRLYSEGKMLIPSLDDFMDGLFFYSEMEFHYNDKRYGVVLKMSKSLIAFYEYNNENTLQHYTTREEFMDKANIDGLLLKDIWDKIKNADYMSCP